MSSRPSGRAQTDLTSPPCCILKSSTQVSENTRAKLSVEPVSRRPSGRAQTDNTVKPCCTFRVSSYTGNKLFKFWAVGHANAARMKASSSSRVEDEKPRGALGASGRPVRVPSPGTCPRRRTHQKKLCRATCSTHHHQPSPEEGQRRETCQKQLEVEGKA